MSSMRILLFSSYPTPSSPNVGIFVYRLVQELVDLGHKITIISPQKITFKNIFLEKPYSDKAIVYQPFYLSCSNKKIGPFNSYYLSHKFSMYAIRRVLRMNKIDYDIIYCHFWRFGFIVADVMPFTKKPMFLAFGESVAFIGALSYFSIEKLTRLLSLLSGYISVSKKNVQRLRELNIDQSNILLAPNAVDISVFYPRDKKEMRRKYNISLDKKIVIFVGSFTVNKGSQRVLSAITNLGGVYGIFLGKGRMKNENGKVLFQRLVKHFQLAEMLSCADVFVLPTLNEGSSNAIVEAMASGLPIVSSDIPAVRDQCDSSFSILIDPNNVEHIGNAIASIIYDDEILQTMSKNAILYSKKYTLSNRAKNISNFLERYI